MAYGPLSTTKQSAGLCDNFQIKDLFTCMCCCIVRPPGTIAEWMYTNRPYQSMTAGDFTIPAKLQGVLYMDGNPAPEDCYVLNGGVWTPGQAGAGPKLRIYDSRNYGLSYPATCMGRGLYCFQSVVCCTSLEFKWESEELKRARIDPYVCMCVGPCTMIGTWDLVEEPHPADADAPEGGVLWRRISLDTDGHELPDGKGSYTLRKIVSAEGTR
eukprot:CAMPEP_0195128126 /NCGR_PEP_ID=MMETSP0448-20130528/138527_1 /TAXON_ID=66468 /ORGANISM="Heterocapsa triquestra, Strain CCMP 448" /LENGTH=212 /DNA_ID=CAMNT_0040165911 /DNA_START=11 /DNA_END=646 /DNA_ORIENTATION=-